MSGSRGNARASGDTPPPSAFAAKRAVAPTRAATGRTKETSDDHPSRSRTLPATSSTARVPRPQKVPEQGNALVASGYDVEELSDAALHREEPQSGQYLSPPMPVPDVRESGSSFQTEPSSYYSAEDNIPSGGPPPPMPVPNPERKDTVERLYDSLWEAAQLSTTPPADGSAPPMPSPYAGQAHESQHEYTTSFYNSDQQWTPHQPLGMPTDRLQRDIQSYTMPSATPGMPHANISTSSAGGSSQVSDGSLGDFAEPNLAQTGPVLPISPLRVTHGAKPPSATVASAAVTKPESGFARPSYVSGQKPHVSGVPTQSRPSGPTPQFTPFYSPATSNTRPEARPTGTSVVAESNTHSQTSPSQSTTAVPGKASYGKQTSFFYDPVQKRWVSNTADESSPGRTESQQPAQTTPSGAGGTLSSSISPKPTGSQLNVRPQAATSEPPRPYTQEAPNPAKPTGKPPAVVTVSPQPHYSASTPGKPPLATNTYTQEANVRPQKVNSGQGKTNIAPPPQSAPTVRPVGAAPIKTTVTVYPPQKESTRPQNGTAPGPTQTSNPSMSQSNIRPQIAQTSQSQPTHTQLTTPASAPKPQQQPSSSYASFHKPELPPTPAPSRPEPTAPAVPPKPAKMTGAVPTGHHGSLSQFDTQYVNMLLALDDIPFIHNTAAGFFSWILLAGFILFPGTFASLQNLDVPANQVSGKLIHVVTNLPLFIVAWVCCAVGASGMCWLWWRWRKNYLWVTSKIFLPGLMNSLAGFISTLANIYGVQHAQYSTTSKVTIIVTGASLVICAVLFLFYTFYLIRNVKKKHDREVGKQRAGKYGEGVVDLSKRRQ